MIYLQLLQRQRTVLPASRLISSPGAVCLDSGDFLVSPSDFLASHRAALWTRASAEEDSSPIILLIG